VRRNLALGLAWLAAAVAAAVVAWSGVGLVGDQVTDDRPATLSSAEIEGELAEATTTTTTAAPPGSGTTTTTAPPSDVQTRSFPTSRGTVALNFSPRGVEVDWASPSPGYQLEQGPGDNGGVRVEFEGDDGRSRVDGWWDGGPQWRVDDDGADGHGGRDRD
jgi:hypothetical protein